MQGHRARREGTHVLVGRLGKRHPAGGDLEVVDLLGVAHEPGVGQRIHREGGARAEHGNGGSEAQHESAASE